MRYKFSINTDDYVCGKCSKKNWEAGTRNDYMLTINGCRQNTMTIQANCLNGTLSSYQRTKLPTGTDFAVLTDPNTYLPTEFLWDT